MLLPPPVMDKGDKKLLQADVQGLGGVGETHGKTCAVAVGATGVFSPDFLSYESGEIGCVSSRCRSSVLPWCPPWRCRFHMQGCSSGVEPGVVDSSRVGSAVCSLVGSTEVFSGSFLHCLGVGYGEFYGAARVVDVGFSPGDHYRCQPHCEAGSRPLEVHLNSHLRQVHPTANSSTDLVAATQAQQRPLMHPPGGDSQ